MRVTDYLGKGIKILQDTDLYRFTSDSILLSRFAEAKNGETAADFCAGCGVVGLNFYAGNENISSVTFFEAQKELALLCAENVSINGLQSKMKVENMRVQEIPEEYREKFSLILCNPPYENGGFENADPQKAVCRKELTLTLKELAEAAKRCLKFGGRFVLCHRADRTAEVVTVLSGQGLEPKKMQFVTGRAGKSPYLLLLEAVKGGKAGVRVLGEVSNERS